MLSLYSTVNQILNALNIQRDIYVFIILVFEFIIDNSNISIIIDQNIDQMLSRSN